MSVNSSFVVKVTDAKMSDLQKPLISWHKGEKHCRDPQEEVAAAENRGEHTARQS